ncbi:MAG TPA: ATP-binding protein [Acidimicrobiales bacterium]|nr:ATP-binding protein [Acidimicrobiales bacterium]
MRNGTSDCRGADLATVFRRALHPPLRDPRFWALQAAVLALAATHLGVDLTSSLETRAFPEGIPVALLILPVGYAALRYGLSGSAATGVWATLLWLPDLLLPHDRGHVGNDLVSLVLVDAVAIFVGRHIEAERLSHARAQSAVRRQLAAEARYRQLFDANAAPILVLDDGWSIQDANPAAAALLGDGLIGRPATDLLGSPPEPDEGSGWVVSAPGGRDYQVRVVTPSATSAPVQILLVDVTEERSEQRRVRHYAELVVKAEEEQRGRLARELHDEPLQQVLHLNRCLETLAEAPELPEAIAGGLVAARLQTLQVADCLRGLARGLRPPALDQLGLVAALRSMLAELEEEDGPTTHLAVDGRERRLHAEVELGVFRIAQEAVRNAARHAAASHVRISVRFDPASVDLAVADDGRGFSPADLDELGAHLGVIGMRERAVLLGGRLELRSSPGAGTVVRAVVPTEG